jgi:hypothetical protein
MLGELLCRLGFHHWLTLVEQPHDFFVYPAHQICGRPLCSRNRMWNHDTNRWRYWNFIHADSVLKSLIER